MKITQNIKSISLKEFEPQSAQRAQRKQQNLYFCLKPQPLPKIATTNHTNSTNSFFYYTHNLV